MKKGNDPQEQARIHLILNGQASKFAYFVERYQREIMAFIQRMDVPPVEAEELTQDTFVRAFRGLRDYEGKASFCTWLLRIAHRVTLNHLKRKHLTVISFDDDNPRTTQAFLEADYSAALDDELDTALSTGREERIQLLEAAILKLPPDDQLLLRLFYFEEQPLNDIAFILEVSAGALSTRLHRLRQRLYRMIEEKK